MFLNFLQGNHRLRNLPPITLPLFDCRFLKQKYIMDMEITEIFQEQSPNHPLQFSPDINKTENFLIDDLHNFPTNEMLPEVAENVVGASTDSSTIVDCCNSPLCGGADHNPPADVPHRSFTDNPFSNDLFVPDDDLGELGEESCEDLQKVQLIPGIDTRPNHASHNPQLQPKTVNRANTTSFSSDISVPEKARTKLSRAAPYNLTSRLLVVTPTASGPTVTKSSDSKSDIASSSIGKKTMKDTLKKKEVYDSLSHNGDGRRCFQCAVDKTPQWRTGPMGPKTLCNACGDRYKSERLVPEYRLSASPIIFRNVY